MVANAGDRRAKAKDRLFILGILSKIRDPFIYATFRLTLNMPSLTLQRLDHYMIFTNQCRGNEALPTLYQRFEQGPQYPVRFLRTASQIPDIALYFVSR